MGLALSFFGGMAERGSELIAEEREDQKKFITESLKQAGRERRAKEDEMKKKREEYKAAYEAINTTYGNVGLSEEQKVALVMQPSLLEIALKKMGDPNFNIVEAIKTSPAFKLKEGQTAQQFVDSRTQMPQGVAGGEVPEAFKTGILKRTDDRTARTVAGSLGYKLEDLLPGATATEEVADVPMASIDREALFAPRDGGERLKVLESKILDAAAKDPDSDETISLVAQHASTKAMSQFLNPQQLKKADALEQAWFAVHNAKTPEEKAAANQRYEAMLNYGKSEKEGGKGGLSFSNVNGLFNSTIRNAISLRHPELLKDGTVDLSDPNDPNAPVTYGFAGDANSEAARKVRQTMLSAVKAQYMFHQDSDGRPADIESKRILVSLQVPFDETGRPIFDVGTAPVEEPRAIATKVGEAPAAATPARAAPIPIRPEDGTVQPSMGGNADLERVNTDIAAIRREIAQAQKNAKSIPKKAFDIQMEALNGELRKAEQRRQQLVGGGTTRSDDIESLLNKYAPKN
jgi:hypothetical protein